MNPERRSEIPTRQYPVFDAMESFAGVVSLSRSSPNQATNSVAKIATQLDTALDLSLKKEPDQIKDEAKPAFGYYLEVNPSSPRMAYDPDAAMKKNLDSNSAKIKVDNPDAARIKADVPDAARIKADVPDAARIKTNNSKPANIKTDYFNPARIETSNPNAARIEICNPNTAKTNVYGPNPARLNVLEQCQSHMLLNLVKPESQIQENVEIPVDPNALDVTLSTDPNIPILEEMYQTIQKNFLSEYPHYPWTEMDSNRLKLAIISDYEDTKPKKTTPTPKRQRVQKTKRLFVGLEMLHFKAVQNQCPKIGCYKKFKLPSSVIRHYKTQHVKDAQMFECPFCPHKASYAHNLSVHLAVRHGNLNLDFEMLMDIRYSLRAGMMSECVKRLRNKVGVVFDPFDFGLKELKKNIKI